MILAARLHNQWLVRSAVRRPAAVVERLCAVQAQDFIGAKWAIGLRAAGLDDAAVENAFDRGEILRTHAMRQQTGWRQFFVDMTAARNQHLSAAHETIETLQREYAFLRLADLASLLFCGVDTNGQAQEMGYDIRLEGLRLVIAPDPFAGGVFDIEIAGRELASSFASVADARAAWQHAPQRTVKGVVSGGASRL